MSIYLLNNIKYSDITVSSTFSASESNQNIVSGLVNKEMPYNVTRGDLDISFSYTGAKIYLYYYNADLLPQVDICVLHSPSTTGTAIDVFHGDHAVGTTLIDTYNSTENIGRNLDIWVTEFTAIQKKGLGVEFTGTGTKKMGKMFFCKKQPLRQVPEITIKQDSITIELRDVRRSELSFYEELRNELFFYDPTQILLYEKILYVRVSSKKFSFLTADYFDLDLELEIIKPFETYSGGFPVIT